MQRFRFMAVALMLVTITSCTHVHMGQRLLKIQIETNGQVAFEGMEGVPDNMPVNAMWDVLGEVLFTSSANELPVNELTGEIVVRIKHVDRELASAKLNSLTLQRNAQDSGWILERIEVERIKLVVAN